VILRPEKDDEEAVGKLVPKTKTTKKRRRKSLLEIELFFSSTTTLERCRRRGTTPGCFDEAAN